MAYHFQMSDKTLLVLIFFFSAQLSCFSQTSLKGRVKDSLQNPLPYANLLAKPQDSLQKIKFAITDEKGRYQLDLKNIHYTVTVSSMGYAAFSFEVFPKGNSTRDITLKPKPEDLKEVVVEMPVIKKKDTIIYNVDKLTTGEERKLKDILKKLPGVEVDRDGTITVQGKKVTVMLVENKKFFGGGSKLAVDNIPAEAVDQVVVLDNYNEVAFLKKLQDSDEMAMNIILKEDKKNFVFGDVEAGKGNKDFYRSHANLFYYSPKTNLNVIGNLNDIGEQVFTYKQFFDFQGGLNSTFKTGNTVFETPNDDFQQFLEKPDVVNSARKFGALNFTQEVNNKLNLSGYGIFSKTKENTFSQSINQYNTFTETKVLSSGTDNAFAIGNLKAVYTPNLTDQWHFKTQFKKTDDQYENRINSIVDTSNNTFLTNKNVNGSFFNETIEWHRKSSAAHTFSFAANYTFDERKPRTAWQTSNPILQGLIPVIEDSITQLKQLKRVKNHHLDAIFKHYWVLDRYNHIYSTVGNTYLNQQFFTRDFQELDDGNINDFTYAGFGNDLNFSLNDFFFGLHYKFKTGIFTFDQGAFLHNYQWKLNQKIDYKRNKTVVLPSFSAKAEFDQSKELTFDYELKSSFSDASQFADRLYLQSYNSVSRGNENLENGLSHNFKLRFTKFSTYRGIRFYATANYIEQIRGVQDAVNYQGINQYVTPILLDNPKTSWRLFGNIRKKISDISFSLGLRYNVSKYKQQVNEVFTINKNNNLSYNVAAKTLFDDFPIIEVGFRQSFGNYTLGSTKSEFVTSEPFLNIDYDFWKDFIASFDYTAYRYNNKAFNQQNNYEIANASLYYKRDSSAWSFKLEAQNLFNVKFKNRNSFSSYIISDTKTYILPRIIMFSVGYNL